MLALQNGSTAQGTQIVQWSDTGSLDQQRQLADQLLTLPREANAR